MMQDRLQHGMHRIARVTLALRAASANKVPDYVAFLERHLMWCYFARGFVVRS
jgi:hypothetical protein